MTRPLRILFLADSHLGLDMPVNPRSPRRRRGHDFLANHVAALSPALKGEVDLVVHGGDVFDRPRVAASLAHQAYQPLLRVADRGVPVFVVPGNHERGRLPHSRFLSHPLVHVFDRPRTFAVEVRGTRIALSGFPYERRDVRTRFPDRLAQTDWLDESAALRLLCIHHCVEGATVGPADFTFTTARDVIRGRDLPPEFAAVFSGHIHRHQVLAADVSGTPLPAPVLYPGSIERTSTAEVGEVKGYMIVEFTPAGRPVTWQFVPLSARPMVVERINAGTLDEAALESALRARVASVPADAVLVIRVTGRLNEAQVRAVSARRVRAYAPPTMNVEVRAEHFTRSGRGAAPIEAAAPAAPRYENLRLDL